MWVYPHKRLSLFCGPAFKQWRCAKAEAQVSVAPAGDGALDAFPLFVIITLPTYSSAFLSSWMLHQNSLWTHTLV